MNEPQAYTLAVAIVTLGVVAAFVVLALRWAGKGRAVDDRLVPRHMAAAEAVLYGEFGGAIVVHHAPDVAMVPAELVRLGKLGSTPNVSLSIATDHGDVLTFGTHEAGAGRVAYVLGGLRAAERCYDAVRIA